MLYRTATTVCVTLLSIGIGVASAQSNKALISISPANPSVEKGKTVQLSAIQSGSTISAQWTSSAPGIAAVNGNGLVTGLAAGKATISAKRGPSRASTTVTVTAPAAAPAPAPAPAPSPTPTAPDPSWVVIYPGDVIQNYVNAHPAGTTFYLKAGTHRRQTITPKSDQRFIGETGAVLDGESVTPIAFSTLTLQSYRVTVKGLIIRNYASGSSQGAIQGDNGISWIVEDNTIHNNLVIGIRLGPRWTARRNKVYRNGLIGISGYAANYAVVEGNEVYENVYTADAGITAQTSGMKFLRCIDLVIRNNYVHHNYAKGIWIDGGYPTSIIEGNRVTYNAHAGIWVEGSYSAIIRNNVAERNGPQDKPGSLVGHAGIQVTNSPNVEVYGNQVLYNSNGIGVMQSYTPTTHPTYGVLEIRNLYVHDNVVRMQIGRTGLVQIINNTAYYTSKNNRFVHNTYYLGPNQWYYAWSDQSLHESQWKAWGQDMTGTFIR